MDVQKLLETKKVPFQLKGADYIVSCLSPDHEDRHPSMRIDKITGIFNCFSCGFKGNLFTHFGAKANVLEMKRQKFKTLIANKLAENIGLELPRDRIEFDRNWRGISGETYKEFEAFEHSDPSFINRVVFPIRGPSGKISAFNARALTPEIDPRYLVYPAGAKLPLFPGRPRHIEGRVILVEGLFDMLNLHDKGLTNAVCAFGTRQVTADKLNILKMQGVIGIDIFFDGDEAGQKAAVEIEALCEELDLLHRNVCLPKTDPGELTAQKVLMIKENLYG